jgi:hypothetical protein
LSVGDIITDMNIQHPIAIRNVLGARKAAAEALKSYLLKTWFMVDGGEKNNTEFQLNDVRSEWPDPAEELNYPIASIIEAGFTTYSPHNFVPTPLEETLGEWDCLIGHSAGAPQKTVLWKENELSTTFQIDYWLATKPDREAIEGLLPYLFNPGEDRTGILIEGPESYFKQPIRFTLMNVTYDDSNITTYQHEYRLRTSVMCESDIVSLRLATLMQPIKICVDVEDPNDPEES